MHRQRAIEWGREREMDIGFVFDLVGVPFGGAGVGAGGLLCTWLSCAIYMQAST